MQRFRFRAEMDGQAAQAVRVDREKRIIYGVQVLSVGEAKGHDLLVDEVMVEQAVAAINAGGDVGMKSRFTHPGACSDGMGKMLGRLSNARRVGDSAVADLHLADFASKGPEGDLAGHVMDIAEEDPTACGLSIVFTGKPVWKLMGGGEVAVDQRPANATTDLPFARIAKMTAADVVDEPAATTGLLAAAFSGTSGADAAEAFATLDAFREARGLSLSQAHSFLTRYFDARGHTPNKGTPMTISPDRLAELCEKHPAQSGAITKAFAAGKSEAEILGVIGEADRTALAGKVEELTKALAAKDEAHVKALAALQAKHDEVAGKYAKLAGLKEHTPADPGSAPQGSGNGDEVEAEWNAMPAAKKLGFFDDLAVFKEARRVEAAELAAKGSKA